MHNENWLDTATKLARAELLKKSGIAVLTGQDNAALPVWRQTSSTATAINLTDSGAALLEPGTIGNDHLPRVKNHVAIVRSLSQASGFRDKAFIASFLKDVLFWHQQSRNGRWNCVIDRYERWGVKPVSDWASQSDGKVSERTFHAVKDWAVKAELIEAKSAKHMGKTKLWIKPTEKLSRMIFEAGFWEIARHEFAPQTEASPAKEKKAAPRGLSAKHKAIVEEQAALYRQTLADSGANLTTQERWDTWHKLTKPTPLAQKRVVAPFAPENSHRRRRLREALGLQWM